MSDDVSLLALPIRLRPVSPMSDEEFMRFSEEYNPVRMELEPNGEILIMSPAGTKTALVNRRIIQALGVWADEDGRGEAFDSSAGFRLPNGSVRSPDAAWVANGRWHALTDAEQKKFSPLCPEFVIEITSPGDRIVNVKAKMVQEWIGNGAELAWLVEPEARRVTIYRVGDEPEAMEDPTSVQGTGCVAGFELVMERIWGKNRG